MCRQLLVMLLRRSILVFALVCVGCSAQSAPSDVSLRIERQVRSFYNIPSNVKVNLGPIKPSEFPNYDLMTIAFEGDSKKQEYEFLLSKDKKTLLKMTKLDLTKDPYAELMKKIDVGGRPVRGNKDAKVMAVNYDDFQCPFCSRMHQTLFPELLKQYGDRVQFIYKDFPLAEIHPWATRAAVDANCLASQSGDAYWDFADYVHANQAQINKEKTRDSQLGEVDRLAFGQGEKHGLDSTKLQACVKAQAEDKVKASIKEGEALGVDATPTLFVNGEKVDGALGINEIRAVLDRALQQAGVPAPEHPPGKTPSSPAASAK
jgi:protein-disulfide isomerase